MNRGLLFLKLISIFTVIAYNFIFVPTAQLKEKPEWSYSGKTGPEFWGELDPAYKKCSIGLKQSPINIDTKNMIKKANYKQIQFRYTPTEFQLVNTGHTIKAIPNNQENILVIGDEEYLFRQLHVHHKSEHEVDNKKFPLELHLVHQNAKGEIAVVGIFAKSGKEATASTLFDNLPITESSKIHINELVNLEKYLPETKNLFNYGGSLTTPPCTENVQWLIFETPIKLSMQKIQGFAKLFPTNFRPKQPLNKRQVFYMTK